MGLSIDLRVCRRRRCTESVLPPGIAADYGDSAVATGLLFRVSEPAQLMLC